MKNFLIVLIQLKMNLMKNGGRFLQELTGLRSWQPVLKIKSLHHGGRDVWSEIAPSQEHIGKVSNKELNKNVLNRPFPIVLREEG